MVVMNQSLSIGAKPTVYLPPLNRTHVSSYGKSVHFKPWSERKFPSLKAVACNPGVNAKCSQGQTQTLTRKTPTITQAPNTRKDNSIKLDDGGSGFPPRDDGGGGGGGGGGENFSGGFYLFGFLMFMGYLKDLEGEQENSY